MPMLPPAPALFSTTNALPSDCDSLSPTMRASASAGPPAGNGTIIRTGRSGYGACADAPALASATAESRITRKDFMFVFLPSGEPSISQRVDFESLPGEESVGIGAHALESDDRETFQDVTQPRRHAGIDEGVAQALALTPGGAARRHEARHGRCFGARDHAQPRRGFRLVPAKQRVPVGVERTGVDRAVENRFDDAARRHQRADGRREEAPASSERARREMAPRRLIAAL